MLFKTKTSIYELKKGNIGFVLTKLAILPGHGSTVDAGKSYEGNRVEITKNGLALYLGEYQVIKTSPIEL